MIPSQTLERCFLNAGVNQVRQDIIIITNNEESFLEIFDALRNNKMGVVRYNDIIDAKVGLAECSPTFLLLDYGIKGANSLLNELVEGTLWPRPYTIVAAFLSEGVTRAAMFRKGADMCVAQPVIAEEILAIIESVQRRKKWEERSTSNDNRFQIEYKELIIDTLHRSVTMCGNLVVLTRKEYNVLLVLATHFGIVMTKEEIHTAVWKTKYDPRTTNVSDQISSLRRKLGLTSKDTNYIQTVIGMGYRFGTLI